MPTALNKSPKVYVAVKTDFTEDGIMLPREITWEDGRNTPSTGAGHPSGRSDEGRRSRRPVHHYGAWVPKLPLFRAQAQISPGIISGAGS